VQHDARIFPIGGTVPGSFDEIVERTPIAPGSTGAPFERVTLADGSVCLIKHMSQTEDAVMRTLHDQGSIGALWHSGVFGRLPPPLASSVLDVRQEGNGWAILMLDLSEALIAEDHVISRAESRRILAALNVMHETLAGERIEGLCSHRDKLELNSPRMIEAEAPRDDGSFTIPARDGTGWVWADALSRGWELFFELTPINVASAIRSIHEDPAPLADEMARHDATIIHGDLQFPNMALDGELIYLLDWGSAAIPATAEEDFSWFLMANEPQIEATHDEILADFVDIRAQDYAPEAFDLASIFMVALMGSWLAWTVVEEPDDSRREHGSVELGWWSDRVGRALTTWSP
jgi:hypothetical protein